MIKTPFERHAGENLGFLKETRARHWTPDEILEDLNLVKENKMTWGAFFTARKKWANPVTWRLFDGDGKLKTVSYDHNTITNVGRNMIATTLAGWTENQTKITVRGTATATTSTTVTDSGASFPTTAQTGQDANTLGYAGMIVVISDTTTKMLYGTIISAIGTALTVDAWKDPNAAQNGGTGSTQTTTVTPATQTPTYCVLNTMAPAYYIALNSSNYTPATADHNLPSEITTAGLSRALGNYAHTAAAGASGTYTLVNTSNVGVA